MYIPNVLGQSLAASKSGERGLRHLNSNVGPPDIDAEILAEPGRFDCEHIADSGFGRLITMEE